MSIVAECAGGEAGELYKFLPYICRVANREYMRDDESAFTLSERIALAIERETSSGTVMMESRSLEGVSSLISRYCYRLWVEEALGGFCTASYCHHAFDRSRGVVFQIMTNSQRYHGWLDLRWEDTT